jgi:hypothetical protein
MADESIYLKDLDSILEEFKGKKGSVIPILQRTQSTMAIYPGKCCPRFLKKPAFLSVS